MNMISFTDVLKPLNAKNEQVITAAKNRKTLVVSPRFKGYNHTEEQKNTCFKIVLFYHSNQFKQR